MPFAPSQRVIATVIVGINPTGWFMIVLSIGKMVTNHVHATRLAPQPKKTNCRTAKHRKEGAENEHTLGFNVLNQGINVSLKDERLGFAHQKLR